VTSDDRPSGDLGLALRRLEDSVPDVRRPGGRAPTPPVRIFLLGSSAVLAAGVVVTALVLGPRLGGIGQSPSNSASSSASAGATATSSATVVPTSTEPIGTMAVAWSRFSFAGGQPHAAAATTPGWAALGDGLAWWSNDGATWEAGTIGDVSVSPPFGARSDWGTPSPVAIAKLGTVWYAVANWQGPDDRIVPVVFKSSDGRKWQHEPSSSWWGHFATGLASDGAQLIATSYDFGLGLGSVFTSADGVIWTEHIAPGGPASMLDLIADADGIVAVGYRYSDSGGEMPVVWLSKDGKAWSETSLPGAPNRTVPWSVARTLSGGYIVLTTTTTTPKDPCSVEVPCPPDTLGAWYSPDGIEWQPSDFPNSQLPSSLHLDLSVVAASPGVLAAGTTVDGPAAWSSVDGSKWVRLALPDSMTATSWSSVVASDTTVLLFGAGDKSVEVLKGVASVQR
jgi:hypothetical protein